MEFRKIIDIPKSDLNIGHRSGLMLLGSCFAESIGRYLLDNKFRVNVNPFGILYNPVSIRQALDLLSDEKEFLEEDIFEHRGVYYTFFHHGEFSDTDKINFLGTINRKRREATADLKQADVLLITFGTAYVFKHNEQNRVVANCHKLPACRFSRRRLDVSEIAEEWSELITRLRELNPSLKFLFTVSPIRHWKDGAHNNQLSKATLLLAIEQLARNHKDVYYFPSYEIVMDELRDYRFYAEDMLHPGETAIAYIRKIFADTYFDDETKQINAQWQSIFKAIGHRPFNPGTDEHKQFLRQTLLKLNELQKKYPYFDCEKEILLLTERLS